MAYETDTATSPVDLLQKLVAFAVAQGWTSDISAVSGSGWRANLHKNSNYAGLRALMNESAFTRGGLYWGTCYGLAICGATGFNGSNAWNAQPGVSLTSTGYAIGCMMPLSSGAGEIIAYHFFSDSAGENIFAVIESTASVWAYIGWGSLAKAGTWTGGPYFLASYGPNWISPPAPSCPAPYRAQGSPSDSAACFVRADVDTWTGKWLSVHPGTTEGVGYTGKRAFSSVDGYDGSFASEIPNYHGFENRLTSALNSQANLIPIRVFAERDGGGFSLLGSIPNIFRATAIGSGFVQAEVYSIGADDYMLFPNFAVKKV